MTRFSVPVTAWCLGRGVAVVAIVCLPHAGRWPNAPLTGTGDS